MTPRKLLGAVDLRNTVNGYAPTYGPDYGVIYTPMMPVFEDEVFDQLMPAQSSFYLMQCKFCKMKVMNNNTTSHFEKCDAIYEHYYGKQRTVLDQI